MASANGWPVSSAAASISSEVVSPLPHSRAIRRKGALVMPAMGASRASAGISTGPIFMGRPVYPRPRYRAGATGCAHRPRWCSRASAASLRKSSAWRTLGGTVMTAA